MPNFARRDPALSCPFTEAGIEAHGGNHAPSAADWFRNDDTLDRQGVDRRRPNGHGICKGVSSSWVMAFLNGVAEAVDPRRYERYYTDFLRYQATMVKDFGKHIDSHVAQFSKLGVSTNITQVSKFERVNLSESDVPGFGRWAAYISCWHHDIAIGGTWGTGSKLYINEPNTGLHGYSVKARFFSDLNEYIAARRADPRKNLAANAPAGYWLYKPG